MQSATREITDATAESNKMNDELDAAERGRGWATLDAISSMEGASAQERRRVSLDRYFWGWFFWVVPPPPLPPPFSLRPRAVISLHDHAP